MRSDSELNKTFKIELAEEGIIYSVFYDPLPDVDEDARRAELYSEIVMKMLDENKGGKLNAIVDMLPLKDSKITPPGKAGKVYSEIAKDPRVGKIAIVGINNLYKALVKFILMAAHKSDDIKTFDNRENATKWLREQRDKSKNEAG